MEPVNRRVGGIGISTVEDRTVGDISCQEQAGPAGVVSTGAGVPRGSQVPAMPQVEKRPPIIPASHVAHLGTDAPIAGTRASVRRVERAQRRYSLMRGLRDWDAGKRGYLVAKRLFDIAFSGAVIVVGFVPSLILCALICIDSPGFPLYAQKRVGRLGPNGEIREFTMWKFRSMVKDADKMVDQLRDQNEVEGPMFKMEHDPRVTRVGHFIRKHSIDEFPQFLNVFVGQLSVVGPRPPLPFEVAQYDEWAMQRLAVKPGLTGPWQVGGRSNLDFDDMVRLDLGYIAKRSVKTDLMLIAQTVKVVFTGEGAM